LSLCRYNNISSKSIFDYVFIATPKNVRAPTTPYPTSSYMKHILHLRAQIGNVNMLKLCNIYFYLDNTWITVVPLTIAVGNWQTVLPNLVTPVHHNDTRQLSYLNKLAKKLVKLANSIFDIFSKYFGVDNYMSSVISRTEDNMEGVDMVSLFFRRVYTYTSIYISIN
jgi:hypothetical protein